jgi:hypothetical protein
MKLLHRLALSAQCAMAHARALAMQQEKFGKVSRGHCYGLADSIRQIIDGTGTDGAYCGGVSCGCIDPSWVGNSPSPDCKNCDGTGVYSWEKLNAAAEAAPKPADLPDEPFVSVRRDLFERMTEQLERADRLLNTPEVVDFAKGVQFEAVHQRARWGSDHDAGKTDADWFWLVGYLAGKALHKPEKRLHHLITAAAALANWHAYTLGKTNMRPGIDGAVALGDEQAVEYSAADIDEAQRLLGVKR